MENMVVIKYGLVYQLVYQTYAFKSSWKSVTVPILLRPKSVSLFSMFYSITFLSNSIVKKMSNFR